MASLTPLSKGLIGLVVIGGMASAVWHLYLKERMSADQTAPSAVTAPMTPSAEPATMATTATAPAPTPAVAATPEPAPAVAAPSGAKLSADEHFDAGRKLVAAGDYARARAHLEQALQQGNAGAACLLGEMTLKGQGGIAADQAKAAQLFQLAQSRNTICFTAGQ